MQCIELSQCQLVCSHILENQTASLEKSWKAATSSKALSRGGCHYPVAESSETSYLSGYVRSDNKLWGHTAGGVRHRSRL